jgi:hypothetical protein
VAAVVVDDRVIADDRTAGWERPVGLVDREVLADGRPVAIGGPKPPSLLVLLLLNAGRAVPSGQVIEALWGGRPPLSGRR